MLLAHMVYLPPCWSREHFLVSMACGLCLAVHSTEAPGPHPCKDTQKSGAVPPPGRAGSPARPSHPFRFPGRSTGERTPHRDGEPDEPDRVPSHPRRPGGVIRPAHRDVSSFCVIPLAPVDGPASCRCSFLSFAPPRRCSNRALSSTFTISTIFRNFETSKL